jgi:3-phenylpropionate/cinnamic acid dioxygenase small subunit
MNDQREPSQHHQETHMEKNPLEPTPLPPSVRANRVAIGSQVYNDIVEFMYDEAEYFDTLRLRDWIAMVAKDIEYTVPLRHTRATRDQDKSVVRTVQHMFDDYRSIMLRVMRVMDTRSAWGEDPPSRTKHMVSNIRVYRTDKENEFKVHSYLLLTRNRFDNDKFDLIPCERHDVIRKTDEGYLLARREVIIDQAVLGTPNLGIFL